MNKKRFRQVLTVAMFAAQAALPMLTYASQVTADSTGVVAKLQTIVNLVLAIIQVIGIAVTAWGVFDFASGYQSHDGTTQTNGLKRIVAGLIMVCASGVLSAVGVTTTFSGGTT